MSEAASAQPLPLADPTALGLIGLAVGCAALTPIALGLTLTPAALKTAAVFCIAFGGCCQLIAGLGSFVNRNVFGGTLLTAFSFNWFINGWILFSVASGTMPDHTVLLATDLAFLLVFVVMTWGFAYFSAFLAVLLLDIDLMYVFKVVAALTGTHALNLPIAACTILLGLLALWIVFAMLINPTAGRAVFKLGGPVLKPHV